MSGLGAPEDPRGGEDTGQTTPERDSASLPSVPGAPKKRKSRAPPKRDLMPKKLSYKDVDQTPKLSDLPSLSQDAYELLEARVNTDEGTWVMCDHPDCGKWRYLADTVDPTELPEKWYCSMNQDPEHNSCEAVEDVPNDELQEVKYFVGSIVWAKVNTYPWWPAMVDDDPDNGLYQWQGQSDGLPTHYHVTFLDKKVTRAWVRDSCCTPFLRAVDVNTGPKNKVPCMYKKMFNAAVETAQQAVKMSVAARIKKYCFVNRYRGKLNSSQAPKEKRPRGRPPKTRTLDASVEQANKGSQPPARPQKTIATDTGSSCVSSGSKRKAAAAGTSSTQETPVKRPHKAPQKITAETSLTQEGGAASSSGGLQEASAVDASQKQATKAVKRPKAKPSQNLKAKGDEPEPSAKKPQTSAKQSSTTKRNNSEPKVRKKSSAKESVPADQDPKPRPAHTKSAILTMRRIQAAQKAQQAMETHSSVDEIIATVSSASYADTADDMDNGTVQVQEQQQSQSEKADTASDRSLFPSPVKNKGSLNPKKVASGMPRTPRHSKDKAADVTPMSPNSSAQGNSIQAEANTETTLASEDSSAGQTQTNVDQLHSPAPSTANTAEASAHQTVELTSPQDCPKRDNVPSSGAQEPAHLLPLFDTLETGQELIDLKPILHLLDAEISDMNSCPRLSTPSRFGTGMNTGAATHLMRPCYPMDLDEMTHDAVLLEGAQRTAKNEEPVPTPAMVPQPGTSRQIEKPSLKAQTATKPETTRPVKESVPTSANASATKEKTAKTVSTKKQMDASKTKPLKSGNAKEVDGAKKAQSTSNQGSTTEPQGSKPKKPAISKNKENPKEAIKTPTVPPQTVATAQIAKPLPTPSQPSIGKILPPKVPKFRKPSFKVPTKNLTTKIEGEQLRAALAEAIGAPQPRPNAPRMADSEDSDFDSLSNTQELAFDDTLSQISQSLEMMSQEHESDFESLETVDSSQSFQFEE